MPGRFSDQVVIITGSSQGIGRETARMFAEEGANVTITGRNQQALEETRTILLKNGAKNENILIVTGDLLESTTHQKIINETIEKFRKIDVLVNNAGAAGEGDNKSTFEASLEDFDYIINLNLRSVLAMSKLALPHLEKNHGCIVNISSIASTDPSAYWPYYGVAKAGIDHLTRCMALAYIEKGVRVNAVNPGLTRTTFMSRIGMPQEFEDQMVDILSSDRTQMPIGRAARPEEIGELILFLTDTKKSEYIIGQCIVIDGGRSLARPVVKSLLPTAK